MREAGKPATLNELVGSSSSAPNNFGLKDLPDLLGEKMPEMPHNRVGRYRLMNALKLRFGPGFRNIPGVKNIIGEFDQHVQTHNVIKANRET